MSDFREAVFLNIRCQIEALISRREGMIAENKQRERRGESLAYGEKAFDDLEQSFVSIIPDPHGFE